MDARRSNFVLYYHVSLPCIVGYAINANHRRSEPMPSHCVTRLHFLNMVDILRGLVIIGVTGFS
jgi:hypothetical protein